MRNFIINGITDAILSIIPALIITLVVELFKKVVIKKKENNKKIVIEYIFILYLLSLLRIVGVIGSIGVEYHAKWFFESIKRITFGFSLGPEDIIPIILNVILLVPFGLLIPIIFEKTMVNCKNVFIVSFCLTCIIEITQMFSGRMFQVSDIIANTLGGIIGFAIFNILKKIRDEQYKQI